MASTTRQLIRKYIHLPRSNKSHLEDSFEENIPDGIVLLFTSSSRLLPARDDGVGPIYTLGILYKLHNICNNKIISTYFSWTVLMQIRV